MGISESEAGEKRYSKPTNPIRSPRLTWSETSSKSARPAKYFESWETVSIAESERCSLVPCPAQLVNHEWRKGISDIEGKAARVAASEWSRGAARDIDGKTERSNGAFGKSDIEGKTAREAASQLGKERVSNGREPMSQSGSRTSFNQHK